MNLENVPQPRRSKKRRKANEATYQHEYDSALKLWDIGRTEQAVAHLETALELVPDRADGWCQLGEFNDALSAEALARDDQREADRLREKAAAALRQSITLSPDLARAHYALANVYWGRDSRMALAELEAAAKCDPHEYGSVFDRARTTVRECTYRLARMNVIVLGSAQEMPSTRMLRTEFFFAEFRLGCAVMHAHVSDNQPQWAYVWLFESEHPDLSQDEPVAELTISSAGDVSISAGCPADYHALKAHAAELGVLAGWLGTNGPPASYSSSREAIVEDGTPDVPPDPAPAVPSDTSRTVIESPPPDVDTRRVATRDALEVPEKAISARVNVSPARSGHGIVWTSLGAVLIAAAAGLFYFEDFGAAPTSEEQAPVSIESPSLLPPGASDAAPESDGTAASGPISLTAETPAPESPRTHSAATPSPAKPASTTPPVQQLKPAATPSPAKSASTKPPVQQLKPAATPSPAKPASTTPPVQQLKPAAQQARKGVDTHPRRASEPAEPEAPQATVFEPPRRPVVTEPVVAEVKPVPKPQPTAVSPMDRMRKELAQCGEMGALRRGLCVERTRWNHCHPDNWNKTPECAAP